MSGFNFLSDLQRRRRSGFCLLNDFQRRFGRRCLDNLLQWFGGRFNFLGNFQRRRGGDFCSLNGFQRRFGRRHFSNFLHWIGSDFHDGLFDDSLLDNGRLNGRSFSCGCFENFLYKTNDTFFADGRRFNNNLFGDWFFNNGLSYLHW